MQPYPIARILAAACLLVSAGRGWADGPPLRDLLRDGLYAEEVSRDSQAAAKHYEDLLARYGEQRSFAASALFRLAEVRRKQDRKEDAIQLYKRLLAEFPSAEIETKIARENLAALGGKAPEVAGPPDDPEAKELARLQVAAISSPDVLLDPQNLTQAVNGNFQKVVKLLLAAGARPFEGSALVTASEKGNLSILQLLLDADGPVPESLATEVIQAAIRNNRYTTLDFLLARGLKPGTTTMDGASVPLLARTLMGDGFASAEILLKHGANIDEMLKPDPSGDFTYVGTALHLATREGKGGTVKWLLEKGAKPDLPDPLSGFTPLHLAAMAGHPGTLDIMEKLLAAGADPNRISADREAMNLSEKFIALNSTPLEISILKPMGEQKVKLLLKHGADPNRKNSRAAAFLATGLKNPELTGVIELLAAAGLRMNSPDLMLQAVESSKPKLVEFLLKHGADPNIQLGNRNPLIVDACDSGDARFLKILLDAGADPQTLSSDGNNLMRIAASRSSDGAVECLKLLADAGVKPAAEWATERYSGVRHQAIEFLMERFILPDLMAKESVSFVIDLLTGIETLVVAEKATTAKPPELQDWLRTHGPKLKFAVVDGKRLDYRWRIWRIDSEGKLAASNLEFHVGSELPELRWGDVIECRLLKLPSDGAIFTAGLGAETEWALRQRIAFPVTVEVAGKSRRIQVRGDRVMFDPTRDEVPLANVQGVVNWLWQEPGLQAVVDRVTPQLIPGQNLPLLGVIVISRSDWPEVRLNCDSKEARMFQLESGDRVKLEISEDLRKDLAHLRKSMVTLKSEGLPFARSFFPGQNPSALLLPTLIQALVETQVPAQASGWNERSGRMTLEAADLPRTAGMFRDFTVLPFPDLSRIRIRRLQEDGSEKVIEVDLTKALAEVITLDTLEEARNADVALKWGDVVEIPVKRDASGGDWKGFSAEESRFFAMALSGKVQVVTGNGAVTFSELDWRPAQFIETPAGWLPVPRGDGVPSLRAAWLLPDESRVKLTRDGVSEEHETNSVFLREGDVLHPAYSQQPEPRQPRPRARVERTGSLPEPIR